MSSLYRATPQVPSRTLEGGCPSAPCCRPRSDVMSRHLLAIGPTLSYSDWGESTSMSCTTKRRCYDVHVRVVRSMSAALSLTCSLTREYRGRSLGLFGLASLHSYLVRHKSVKRKYSPNDLGRVRTRKKGLLRLVLS